MNGTEQRCADLQLWKCENEPESIFAIHNCSSIDFVPNSLEIQYDASEYAGKYMFEIRPKTRPN